ncbi:MAG: anthranilate synthase component I family protein [Syntrophorhabdales bacterium]|jgi:anthranilate synthase component 1
MYPPLKEFKKLWKEFDRITAYKEMGGDMDTPVSMLAKFLSFERVILLESAEQDKTYSRFSFLAFTTGRKLVLKEDGLYEDGEHVGPLSLLGGLLSPVRTAPHEGFGAFSGGYVGYLNFEFVGECGILKKGLSKQNPVLGVLYPVERFCVYDNYTNKLYLAISRATDASDAEDVFREIARELDRTEEQIGTLTPVRGPGRQPVMKRTIPRGLFIDKARRTRDMIAEGEAIQIVLSDFLEADDMDPFEFYRNLRKINPSPYMYFLKDDDACMVGSSPEIHLRIRDRVATLKPIAGTKPRPGNGDLDEVVRALAADEKERAEHLMLVDLARNDLSRICKVGTVEVRSFMQPEVYSHVVHLVSEVQGLLADGVDVIEALKQTFPAGTVSGAPKVRAIEVIDDMEDHVRGPYAGCVGYIGFNGNLDMAITIRTALFAGTKARLQAGAGIVFDSVPEREYDEVMNKLLVLMKSGGLA